MATKPVTLPAIWASLPNYDNGPFIGQPMKIAPGAAVAASGHRPGKDYPTAAEHENSQQNRITSWINDWLFLGSSAGASDAHLVETTSTGRTALTGLDITNTIGESGVISITNGGSLPSFFGRNEVGPVFRAITINGPGPAFRGDLAGIAVGLNLSMTGMLGASGNAILISGNAATTRDAIKVDMLGTAGAMSATTVNGDTYEAAVSGSGRAFFADLTGTSSKGLKIEMSGVTTGYGISISADDAANAIEVNHSGGGSGIYVSGGTGPCAILSSGLNGVGLAVDHYNSFGIDILGNAAATGISMRIQNPGTGHCIESICSGTDGYALLAVSGASAKQAIVVSSSNPVYGEMEFDGKATRPTNNGNGQLTYLSTEAQFGQSSASDGAWRGIWSSTGGYAMARGTLSSKLLNSGAGVWSDTITITANNGNGIKVAFRAVLIRISCDVRSSAAVANVLNVRVLDDTDGGTVIYTRSGTNGFNHTFDTANVPERSVSISFLATPQTTGTQVYRLQMGSNSAASNLTAVDISIDFLGQS